MDLFHMTFIKNKTFHKIKNSKKHNAYEDKTHKSDTRRKVVIFSGTLMWNFMIRTIFSKFYYVLYHCRPTMDLTKKLDQNI